MNTKNSKLELQWPNKDKSLYFDLESGNYEWVDKKDPRVTEPRILVEKQTYGDKDTDNLLIKGDNLLALKALQQDYQGKVKLIFIDPPYNTGNAFKHYDDGIEHSIWLSLMQRRLLALKQLLSIDGTIWVVIDDSEGHYLKVLMDEIFGREHFIASVAWRSSDAANNDAKTFSIDHNSILVYSKSSGWLAKSLQRTEEANEHYKNPDNDPNGSWFAGNVSSPKPRPNLRYKVKSPKGILIDSPANGWRWKEETFWEMVDEGEIVFSNDGTRVIKKTYLSHQSGLSPSTMWDDIEETGHNRQAKYELKKLFPDIQTSELFSTPKPEKLIRKILQICTDEGDYVLDSFAGSGTTGAVAHKMKRKWIMVELGDQTQAFTIPRLEKVISGVDQGGISRVEKWDGGGGFKYFELGESLFVRDSDLRLTVINPKMYNGSLIRAVLKVEGFKLKKPDNGLHGMSGTTAAHVTEQYLTQEYVDTLLNEIGDQAKFIVIYAKTISSKIKLPDNTEIRRIPDVLLKKFTV